MIRLNNSGHRIIVALSFLLLTVHVFGQTPTSQAQVVSAFDSLSISNISAAGNLQTGAVQISMSVQNNYHKLAQIDFGGGAFDDFGVTDAKGIRYKLCIP